MWVRNLIFLLIVIVGAVVVFLVVSIFSRSEGLRIVAWGGTTQDALRATMFRPFSEESNKSVSEDTYDGSLARLRTESLKRVGSWDVVEVETTVLLSGVTEGLYGKIQPSDAVSSRLKKDALHQQGVGLFEWWTVLAWNKTRLPVGTPTPSSWADFWDLKKYPGTRGIRKSPRVALEIALLADGVASDALYPLDVDRALRKLDEIKGSIVWWTTGGEQQTRLLGEYTMSTAWSGRVWAQMEAGEPVEMTVRYAMADRDWWVIMKNSARSRLAEAFLEYSTRKEVQARFANATGYGPVNPDAYDLLSTRAKQYIPDPKAATARPVNFDARWWADNEVHVLDKWNLWLARE